MTLAEDLKRAKEILAKGTFDTENRFRVAADAMNGVDGALMGASAVHPTDVYAAYKLLKSFVAALEAPPPPLWVYYRTDGDSGWYNVCLFTSEDKAWAYHRDQHSAYGQVEKIIVS